MSKYNKRFKKFSAAEKAAYWYGVGVNAAIHSEQDFVLDNTNNTIRKSALAGYDANNLKDKAKKYFSKYWKNSNVKK